MAKNLIGSYPFVPIENRPAPLSFVKLSLSAYIYYICHTNLGAKNYAANLRFVRRKPLAWKIWNICPKSDIRNYRPN